MSLLKEDYAPAYSRIRILAYIARAQEEMFNNDCLQMQFLNRNDVSFPIPFIVTTDSVLTYTPSASNLVDSAGAAIALTVGGRTVAVRKISRIFIEDTVESNSYLAKFRGCDFVWTGMNPLWNTSSSTIYSEVPVDIRDRTNLADASFLFLENPGASTSKYYIEFYYGAVSLSSESIPLSVDGDKWTEAFVKAIRGYIEESRNGRSELLDGPANTGSFRNYWIPKFRNSMNSTGSNRRALQFGTRECG